MGVVCPLEEGEGGDEGELCDHERIGGTILAVILGVLLAYGAVAYLWSAPFKVF